MESDSHCDCILSLIHAFLFIELIHPHYGDMISANLDVLSTNHIDVFSRGIKFRKVLSE